MRVKSISISERDLIFIIGGQLFDQAPNRQPRKVEVIMQKVRDTFRKDAQNNNEFYSAVIPEKEIYNYIKTLLMNIPEFVDLNLSQIEFEDKISVNDENRVKYHFTSRYDKETADSWRYDFIDLDAFIKNVYNRFLDLAEAEKDCFCCVHREKKLFNLMDKKACKTCLLNPDHNYNYECSRKPKGEYTFSCKYDCPEHKMICCEECEKKRICINECDANSKTCGNKTIK
jgi:hypothetical protein